MTVTERLDFARKHITDKTGNPFSTEGREWVVQIFRALDGYHAEPVDPEHLCGECARKLGNDNIYDGPDELAPTRKKHGSDGCKGLKAVKIVGVVFAAERRSGKTFTFSSFVLSDVVLNKFARWSVLCPALDQAKDGILAQNYFGPIERSKVLSKRVRLVGNKIVHDKNDSRILAVAHSSGSVSGKGEGGVVIEEARDIDPTIAGRIIFSVIEEYDWQCIKCGFLTGEKKEPRIKTCPQCKAPRALQVHQGRLIITSNKGLATGDPKKDWFHDLVTVLRKNPDPQWYLFDPPSDQKLNPDVETAGTKSAIVRVMSQVEGLREIIAGEASNDSLAQGADFLSDAEIDATRDRTIQAMVSSSAPSVAFLDTSRTGDLCSLVVWGQDHEREDQGSTPWQRLRLERWDLWRPRDFPGGVLHEGIVLPTIDLVMETFPALQVLMIDVRGGLRWALELGRVIQHSKPYRHRVEVFESKGELERMIGWQRLWEATRARTIRLPYFEAVATDGVRCDLWKRELKGAEWHVSERTGLRVVRDKDRKRSHVELTESSALCFWRISKIEAGMNGLRLADVDPSLAQYETQTQRPGAITIRESPTQTRSNVLATVFGGGGLRGVTTKGGWRD